MISPSPASRLAYSVAQYVNVAHAWYRLREIVDHPFAGARGFAVPLLIATGAASFVLFVGRTVLLRSVHSSAILIVGCLAVAAFGGAVLVAILLVVGRNEVKRVRSELSGGAV